jgi:hypothetical protein
MPIEFACYASPALLHLRLRGRVTIEDMLEVQKAYANSPDFCPGIDELIEFLPGADLDMTYAEMRRLRRAEEAYYEQADHPPRCAILAPDETQFGMGRMYAALTDLRGDLRTEVVTTRQEALTFLGVTEFTLTVA